MNDPLVDAIRARGALLRERIERAGGDPDAITIIAVTKTFGADVARAAVAAGFRDLGENYAQDLEAKAADLAGDPAGDPAGVDAAGPVPRWHFIGRLQTNKVRKLAPWVALWQTVDRPDLVREIARRAPGAAVLVQVNLSGEAQKGGCAFEEATPLVGLARDAGLDVRGLMGVGPAGAPEAARPGFRRLVAAADDLGLPVRSIGMTHDLEVAVEEGATMVRVGRGLVGPRST